MKKIILFLLLNILGTLMCMEHWQDPDDNAPLSHLHDDTDDKLFGLYGLDDIPKSITFESQEENQTHSTQMEENNSAYEDYLEYINVNLNTNTQGESGSPCTPQVKKRKRSV